ncbi:unnamed protein product, partial [Heterosigma akashiwo]
MIGVAQMWIGLNFMYQVVLGWVLGGLALSLFLKYERLFTVMVHEHFARSELKPNLAFALFSTVFLTALGIIPYGLVSKTFSYPESWKTNAAIQCSPIAMVFSLDPV